jgi:hypothetical protein
MDNDTFTLWFAVIGISLSVVIQIMIHYDD